MFDAFLVTWREFAEALLIIVMFRECFLRAGRHELVPLIGRGLWIAAAGIALSVLMLISFMPVPAFDALCTVVAALSVAIMAIGVAASARRIDEKVSDLLQDWIDGPRAPIVMLALIAFLVLREGLELFVMLRAIAPTAGVEATFTGAALGLVAVGLTTRIWAWGRARFGLLMVFRFTAVLLLALAVKMLIRGFDQFLRVEGLPIDQEYWHSIFAPFLTGGEFYLWLYSAMLAPPLVYFVKSWWREASWKGNPPINHRSEK